MSESKISSENSGIQAPKSRLFQGAGFFEFESFNVSTLLVESRALQSNPLRDPSARRSPVLVPKGQAPETGWPVVVVLAGFTGNGPNYFNLKTFEPNFPQVLDRLVNQREAPRAVYVFAEAMTYWGGSQFINSPHTGNYEDYIAHDLVNAIRAELSVAHLAQHWCITGGSSGGYGALHLGSRYPEIFGQIAAIAPDSFFEASLLPEYWTALPTLEKLGGVPGVRAEKESGKLQRRKDWHTILNAVAMGLCYSEGQTPDERDFPIPLQRRTGLLNLETWPSWKRHDPVVFIGERIENVRKSNGIYLDVGARDQFHLQFGTRQIHDVLRRSGIIHTFTEFDGNHFDIGDRRPQVWRWLLESQGWRP